MGILGNIFSRKNQIDEKLENINILMATMRQNEALIETKKLISELMQKPSSINGMTKIEELGNFLTHQLNNFQKTDEIQFIVELAFFASTKAINNQTNPNCFYDRLTIMYNAEDFFIDTVKESNNLQYNPLSRMGSMNNVKHMAEDLLLNMRYHDLLNENKFYRNGSNDSSFNGQEFIDITNMIKNGQFGSANQDEIASKGNESIIKCYNYIAKKYSLDK
jgi:hypothetical protein